MNSLTTSIILLLIAIVLLWMAVTDKLGRVLDAFDVVTGKSVVTTSPTATLNSAVNSVAFTLPSLPALGNNAQVPA